MINYAHRGASEYAPENTLAAFYLGLEMGANGIETDIHETKDGQLVLFHDDELKRILPEVCGGIPDYTYEALCRYDFGGYKHPRYQGERLVLLEDFLRYFGGKPLEFAIEIKQPGTERAALDMIDRYGLAGKCVMTSFEWDSLIEIRRLNPDIRTGYLTRSVDAGLLSRMRREGLHQLCPRADLVTRELVQQVRQQGFTVRAWGVSSRESMRHCYRCGVDGMTVNFPDALAAFEKEGGACD